MPQRSQPDKPWTAFADDVGVGRVTRGFEGALEGAPGPAVGGHGLAAGAVKVSIVSTCLSRVCRHLRLFQDPFTGLSSVPLASLCPNPQTRPTVLGHLTPKTLRKALYVGLRDMKLQCSPLKYGQFITKPCVSPQVFYGSRRRTRCVLGSEAFRTMEQTWESQSGGALESNDTVKTK